MGSPPHFNLYFIISNWVQPNLSWAKGGCWLISIASENAKWDVVGLWQQGRRGLGRNRQEIRCRLNDVQRYPLVSVFWMLFFHVIFAPTQTMSQMNICLSFWGESSLATAPSFPGQSLTLPRFRLKKDVVPLRNVRMSCTWRQMSCHIMDHGRWLDNARQW